MTPLSPVRAFQLYVLLIPTLLLNTPEAHAGKALQQLLADIQLFITAGRYEKAQMDAEVLLEQTQPGSQKRAMVLRTLTQIAMLRGDYTTTSDHILELLDNYTLPNDLRITLETSLAQAWLQQGKVDNVIDRLTPLLNNEQLSVSNPLPWMILASALVSRERYSEALPVMKTAIALNRHAPAAWHELLLSIQFQLAAYEDSIATVKTLLDLHPNRARYWRQLASLYLMLDKPDEALAIMETGASHNLLDRLPDIGQMTWLRQSNGQPAQAARHLASALEKGTMANHAQHWEQLGELWLNAKETELAIDAFAKAGEHADSGQPWQRQAELQIHRQDWPSAATSLTNAIEKGGLKDAGKAWLLLGYLHLKNDNIDLATHAFQSATDWETVQNDAQQWLTWLAQSNGQPND
ncbi:hypothetical protein GCM10023116_42270 [Kistimonas scapharcae]|uniref:Tetratricopeptide repeat protein n=1 Tax=Kistimonas scapharcae TaxID=1036133 RepID=A0ABP8V6R0_9GAMM